MTRLMFELVVTWNPIVGCEHDCCYCWAKKLALGRLKHLDRYKDGFVPRLVESELPKSFSGFSERMVFVGSMGDMWGEWVPDMWLKKVGKVVERAPFMTNFLFLTKNPAGYRKHFRFDMMLHNVMLGVTLETNRPTTGVSCAPSPLQRAEAMLGIPAENCMVCIEPILDFDLEEFVFMVHALNPAFVYVGYDNHNKQLNEPPLAKTKLLIDNLSTFTKVIPKTLRKAWWEE